MIINPNNFYKIDFTKISNKDLLSALREDEAYYVFRKDYNYHVIDHHEKWFRTYESKHFDKIRYFILEEEHLKNVSAKCPRAQCALNYLHSLIQNVKKQN